MSQVDEYCKGCRYLSTVSGGRNCNYNYLTGKLRGCPAGFGCIHHTNPSYSPKTESKTATISQKETHKKRGRPSTMTQEEAYEREKERRRKAAREFREKSQGRQRAVLLAYKEATGENNYEIAEKIGISESRFRKWLTEYAPANWDKLAIIGVEKPEGL